MRKMLAATGVAIGLVLSTGVVTAPAQAAPGATVERWVDGDTVVTNRGTVRLIGVDTPEIGQCGSAEATALAERIAPPGSRIRLGNPRSVKNKDGYGRLLRYVNASKTDVGAQQIRNGSWARYDGRDGYQRHPRQAKYRRIDGRVGNWCGQGPTASNGGGTSKPKPRGGGSGSGSVAPSGNNCPANAPIKGNDSSSGEKIYHRPGQQYYNVTNPERCFSDGAAAEAAGYRPAKV